MGMLDDLLRFEDPDDEKREERRAKKIKSSSDKEKRRRRQSVKRHSLFNTTTYSIVSKTIGFLLILAAIALVGYVLYTGISFIF